MFKEFGIGVVISGALIFSNCALGTVFISTVMAEEENEKKDDELITTGHLCIASVCNEEDEDEKKNDDELMNNDHLCIASANNEGEDDDDDDEDDDELMNSHRARS
ncbi:MAG: hypothetical protein E3K37_04435 [Candidatus Kuenenia sp.]|nr:hypothetical protein [Candidatus Kuenenia hertensis]